MEFEWDEGKQDALISMIEPFPALWDKRHHAYSRSDINNRQLVRIGEALGCSGDMVKSQFVLLKRRYASYKDKLKYAGRSGAGASKAPRKFAFAEKMKFLDPTLLRRSTYDSLNVATTTMLASTYGSPSSSSESYITDPLPSSLQIGLLTGPSQSQYSPQYPFSLPQTSVTIPPPSPSPNSSHILSSHTPVVVPPPSPSPNLSHYHIAHSHTPVAIPPPSPSPNSSHYHIAHSYTPVAIPPPSPSPNSSHYHIAHSRTTITVAKFITYSKLSHTCRCSTTITVAKLITYSKLSHTCRCSTTITVPKLVD